MGVLLVVVTDDGMVAEGVGISGAYTRPRDRIMVSGTIGDHGIAAMSTRENLAFHTEVASDTAAPQVEATCGFLGRDPRYVAKEEELVAICPRDVAEKLLAALHGHRP